MKSIRLIEELSYLSPGEFRRFVDFVSSSFFSQNPKLISLVRHLRKASPDFPESLLDKQVLFRVLFGKEVSFSEQKVHDQITQLRRLLEQFLAQLSFERDTSDQSRHMLNTLSQKGMGGAFQRIYKKASRVKEQQLAFNAGHYLFQYQLGELADGMAGKAQTRAVKADLGQTISNLDAFYLATRLRVSCELLNRRNVVNAHIQLEPVTPLVEVLSQADDTYLDKPFIAIYNQIYLALSDPKEEVHYHRLKGLLREHAGLFKRKEAYQMYAYAQNYCIRKINGGVGAYLKELFILYQDLLEQDILLDHGQLAHEHYKNIATVGMRLKEFDWVGSFLEKYHSRLHPDHRVNAYTYNLSAFYYEQQQYSEAMKLLNQVEFTDVFYYLSAKSMLLKIFYEMGDGDSLKYQIQAFRAFLKRNKQLPRYHIQNHSNLLKFVNKAWQIHRRVDDLEEEEIAKRVKSLQEEIKQSQGVSNAAWLRRKVSELIPAG